MSQFSELWFHRYPFATGCLNGFEHQYLNGDLDDLKRHAPVGVQFATLRNDLPNQHLHPDSARPTEPPHSTVPAGVYCEVSMGSGNLLN